jgi:23S rRNA pseudouridine1911/1915/1917 synthase
MSQQFQISEEAKGERLDRFLAQALGQSRTQVQKLIAQGKVLVSGQVRTAHVALKVGDMITVEEGDAVPATKKNIPMPTVIAETEDFVVIEKPTGLLAHPAPGTNEPTLIDWLLEHTPAIRELGDPERPGLVQRLDRLASGLMVIPKTLPMFEHLKTQFQEHKVTKEYLALVDDYVAKPEGMIDFPLAYSDRGHGKMAARPKGEEGKTAVTHFAVEHRGQQATLLRVRTFTGRTHQVRAHMAAMGHPILGDDLYRSKGLKITRPIPRLCLHATRLAFHDLAGKKHEFTSPLPADFAAIAQELVQGT